MGGLTPVSGIYCQLDTQFSDGLSLIARGLAWTTGMTQLYSMCHITQKPSLGRSPGQRQGASKEVEICKFRMAVRPKESLDKPSNFVPFQLLAFIVASRSYVAKTTSS